MNSVQYNWLYEDQSFIDSQTASCQKVIIEPAWEMMTTIHDEITIIEV